VTPLLVALGAMVGAPLRYVTDRYIQSRRESRFPWGTLTVNVAGSLVLGFLSRAAPLSPHLYALVGTGFCGALTTYSTFGFETVRLLPTRPVLACANVVGSVVAGIAAAAGGFALAAIWF
jgi:CrcB protein